MEAYLLITGGLFALVGLRALLSPIAAVATPFGFAADGADTRHFIRSGTGGATLGLGLAMIAGGLLPAYALAGVVVGVAALGGLLFGRLFSLFADGIPGWPARISALFEALGLASGLYWLGAA